MACPIPLDVLQLALTNCTTEPLTCVSSPPACPTSSSSSEQRIPYVQRNVAGYPENGYSAFWFLSNATLNPVTGLTQIVAYAPGTTTKVPINCTFSFLEALESLERNAPTYSVQSLQSTCVFNATDALLAGAPPFVTIRSLGLPVNATVDLVITNAGACGAPGPAPGAVGGIVVGFVAAFAVVLAIARFASGVSRQVPPPASAPASEAQAQAEADEETVAVGNAHPLLRSQEETKKQS